MADTSCYHRCLSIHLLASSSPSYSFASFACLNGEFPLAHLAIFLYRFLIPPSTHQVFGRFVQMKNEITQKEEDERRAAHGVQEISPALVAGFGTVGGDGCRRTGKVGDQWPGDEGADELAECPPDGKDGEEPLVRAWDEFCCIESEHVSFSSSLTSKDGMEIG